MFPPEKLLRPTLINSNWVASVVYTLINNFPASLWHEIFVLEGLSQHFRALIRPKDKVTLPRDCKCDGKIWHPPETKLCGYKGKLYSFLKSFTSEEKFILVRDSDLDHRLSRAVALPNGLNKKVCSV